MKKETVIYLVWTNLKIKVGYLSGVKVVHPLKDLLDELSSLLLTQRLLLGQEIKQLTTRDSERVKKITVKNAGLSLFIRFSFISH